VSILSDVSILYDVSILSDVSILYDVSIPSDVSILSAHLLASIIGGSLLVEEQCKVVMRGLLRAIAFFHEHRIVHRDIKPVSSSKCS
jgi:serine/threonine protein kinase